MNAPDLDRLLGDLRAAAPSAPPGLAASVLDQLGASALQVRQSVRAGAMACLLSILVAAGIALFAVPEKRIEAPPELTLLTRGAGPLAAF